MKSLRLNKKADKNRGSVLALMVLLVLLLSLTSMAMIGLAHQARLRTAKDVASISARFAADAGIERTIYLMNKTLQEGTWVLDQVPTFTNEPLAACNGEYTVTFEGSLETGYWVTSVGKSGRASHTVRVLVELRNPFSEDFAVLTRNYLNMKNKSTIGGYNSGDLSETDVPVAIGTLSKKNSSIDIKNVAVVKGDVYVGPDSDPDKVISMKNRSSITGEIFVMPTPKNLPVVAAPNYIGSKGTISGSNITLTTADSGKYTQIDISNKGKLQIDGDLVLYVTGDVSLDNSAELKVKNGSTLKLYFDSNLDLKNGAEIANESKIPSSVQLFGTGVNQAIDLKNNSDLYGVIYAPNADMVVHNKVDIYGSFIVDNFELKNSGDVYYDKALKNVSISDEAIYFAVTRWEEL
jgi:hypothetical protein